MTSDKEMKEHTSESRLIADFFFFLQMIDRVPIIVTKWDTSDTIMLVRLQLHHEQRPLPHETEGRTCH